ncbi:Mitochondrial zinc maintenance protein-like protein [Hapsidospora chrysogenum ATCC 11550]|uniref:Mitochondrial zinc maintenance protein 1, mitochondrial n=1 Tax=Hapsidospora chrysogenum (strain ATCC 11550 / CBS 779.69 / DSM 880 / IAM 14645 / JCM 23072 / IMI 49137) TaxID=857340 RepID=A0A086SZK7_HAPC1|nr:Mitochondrial zinc maintenance protein-like protein [Hapsidospora chrysogenum ATCC 11550]
MSLTAYRHLLRAARIAFQGDAPILSAAQSQIRNEFRQRSTLSDTESVQAAVQHAEEVARVLRENVVQGRRTDGDEHSYKLNIHEYTERGDNDSIKKAGKGKTTGSGCCQSS